MNGLPDLTRTKRALELYDAGEADGEAVGIAFGLDTADRNSFETCKACVRPGKKHPAHPDDLSFVRRMVKKWEEENEGHQD
jgi:hypothetical protein